MKTARKCEACESTESAVLNLGRRTILLTGPITDSTASNFLAVFFNFAQKKQPINIKLMSPGGAVDAGFAIYDAIRTSGVKVRIEAYGEISSIAALIFLSGDERCMSPNCRFMVHHGQIDIAGELQTVARRVEEANKRDQVYVEILSNRSSLTKQQASELVDREAYLSATQCFNLGIAHGILGEDDISEDF